MAVQTKTITGDAAGPNLLITGGVHGDEFEPMVALRQLAELLDPSALRGSLTVAPVVNEPAFIRGERCAEDGLDLARTCPGSPDGTVTERIAHELSGVIRGADFYIDLHTGGNIMDVWPLTGYKLVDDPEVLEQQRRMARAFNLPLVWGTDAKLEGRTLSIARDAKIPAIYAEYLGSGRCSPEGVQAYLDGCLNVMAELGMIDRELPPSRIVHEVEDHREGAGHMQVRNLSPMTGFFEAAVELGGRVESGEPLGVISDPLGARRETVLASESGVVIVLRTFSRVIEGESLAVVLDLI
ncbi:MAG: succinylglutamate desuccinylase/aspartoacylase family protein [Planctomycetales bacterium]|nr:succinylglutamate desuccinylase/aspartoacylase family protein [Planctomycetales bacterium]